MAFVVDAVPLQKAGGGQGFVAHEAARKAAQGVVHRHGGGVAGRIEVVGEGGKILLAVVVGRKNFGLDGQLLVAAGGILGLGVGAAGRGVAHRAGRGVEVAARGGPVGPDALQRHAVLRGQQAQMEVFAIGKPVDFLAPAVEQQRRADVGKRGKTTQLYQVGGVAAGGVLRRDNAAAATEGQHLPRGQHQRSGAEDSSVDAAIRFQVAELPALQVDKLRAAVQEFGEAHGPHAGVKKQFVDDHIAAHRGFGQREGGRLQGAAGVAGAVGGRLHGQGSGVAA